MLNIENVSKNDSKASKPANKNWLSQVYGNDYQAEPGKLNLTDKAKPVDKKISFSKTQYKELLAIEGYYCQEHEIKKGDTFLGLVQKEYDENSDGLDFKNYLKLAEKVNKYFDKNFNDIKAGGDIFLPTTKRYPVSANDVSSLANLYLTKLNLTPEQKRIVEIQSGSIGVVQGLYGDCWFESPLSGVASTLKGDKSISKMIVENEDGSYSVNFPGLKGKSIIITKQEITNDIKLNDVAYWAKILELAMAKAYPDYAHNGGDPSLALQLLTGKTFNTFNLHKDLSRNQLNILCNIIDYSLKHNIPIVAATSDLHLNKNSIVLGDHAYDIQKIQRIGVDGNFLVWLRNPWGGNRRGLPKNQENDLPKVGFAHDHSLNLGYGEIVMPAKEFVRLFCEISVARSVEANDPFKESMWQKIKKWF